MEKRPSTFCALVILFTLLLYAWQEEASAGQAPFASRDPKSSEVEGPTKVAPTNPPLRMNAEQRKYREVWRLVKDHYLYSEKLSNWQSWEHKFDRQLLKKGDATAAISKMLESLNDDFSYLKSNVGGEPDRGRPLDWKWLNSEIGYLKVNHFFSPDLVGQTNSALRKLDRAKALVIDLRKNPGGKIDVACRAASFFIDRGTVATLVGRNGDSIEEEVWHLAGDKLMYRNNSSVRELSRPQALALKKPLFVLVDSDTRSAAELFAGDLRDLSGATILGTRTFGKGVAQDVYDLDDNSVLKLVTARIHLPSGECVQGVGLQPDRRLNAEDESEQLKAAVRFAQLNLGLIAASSHKQI